MGQMIFFFFKYGPNFWSSYPTQACITLNEGELGFCILQDDGGRVGKVLFQCYFINLGYQ